ncbi:hypothetical protein FBU30_002248 [Linnemannia zychae]|nr:hypothetical protein FBU30_002248 [Linnemannia zychae]
MATPEDSHVLRQLIDQIDGELSTFNATGATSDSSLTSFTTSQGSLALSDQKDSHHESTLSLEPQDQHIHQHQQHSLHQQARLHATSATSAIFGSSFDRPIPQQQSLSAAPIYGSNSLIMNGSYFMGPRAPQYIPSPLASPVSPAVVTTPSGVDQESEKILGKAEISSQSTSSQGSFLSSSGDKIQDQQQPSYRTSISGESYDLSTVEIMADDQVVPTDQEFDDQIKVDVTELYENFGQPTPISAKPGSVSSIGGISKIDTHIPHSPLALKLPELSFSSNDLGSLLANDSGPSSEMDKRTRSHTFNGTTSDIISSIQDINSSETSLPSPTIQLTGPSPVAAPANSLKYPIAFPPRQSSPLKMGYFPQNDSQRELDRINVATTKKEHDLQAGAPDDNSSQSQDTSRIDRKRLSLVTSGVGLAAASAAAAAASRTQLDDIQGRSIVAADSGLDKSLMDLPSWNLAPLSPPVDVKETIPATTSSSTTNSPMNARRASFGQRVQDSPAVDHQSINDIMSPSSATLMTPTTPLTTREARILAGRETLLRKSPDKQRAQRGISSSSTSSSIASSCGKSAPTSQDMDVADLDSQRNAATKSRQSQRSTQSQSSEGGVYGAVPGRGHLTDIPPEKLVFPDLSLKPIPLKAYRVRKMTLQERNMTYAIACEEFTRARSGLDVWALRCMIQDRPALMKDPPAIVKAVVGKQIQAQNDTLASKLSITNGRMSSAALHAYGPLANSISSGHGLGARIKNAGKRLSMDISGGMATTPEPYHPTGTGSLFYKQKSAKSAVELGSWSPGLARGLANLSAATVNSAIPPAPLGSNNRRNSSSASLQPRTSSALSPSAGGSIFLSQKRNSVAASQSSSLSNSLRSQIIFDAQAGSRISMINKEPSINRTNSNSSNGSQNQQQQQSEMSNYPLPYRSGGPLALISPTTTSSPPIATTSVFMERPVKRSLSSHYTRRPASMMITPNSGHNQNQTLLTDSIQRSTSNGSLGSQSNSSFGSISSNPMSDSKSSGNVNSSYATTSPIMELKHQEQQHAPSIEDTSRPAFAYQSDGTTIPYADETKSKDEVYSPLTSPILIPAGGFPITRPSIQTNYQTNGGWSSPLSSGLSRPLTYAGPSSAGLGSNSSLVTSPTTVAREQQQQQIWQQQQQQQRQSFAQGLHSPTTPDRGMVEPVKEKPEKEKSHRYSAASFSSIGSFAKYQKRSSKKDRKKELKEQEQQEQQQQEKRSLDQRYSVAAFPMSQSPSHANDYLTEQSLDKLSDVLPHVDRDRLSIYLQRACGDEMVAIGLAMSDLRSGQL